MQILHIAYPIPDKKLDTIESSKNTFNLSGSLTNLRIFLSFLRSYAQATEQRRIFL